jgi:putative ABC transport system ATP-binding protein
MLELRELVKSYGVGGGEPVRAVAGVSLTVSPGELVALYGPSGSGKTTLLMMVAAWLQPDSGCVVVNGRDISGLSDNDSARYRLGELGFVRQSFDLLPGASAVDNSILKLITARVGVREARQRMVPVLEQLGLGTRLAHSAQHLSMGERQRVMIARALSNQPKVLLADEPTGNLDTKLGREVLALLVRTCREQNIAGLLATHDPQAAAFADRSFVLRDGQLAAYQPDSGSVLP